jgi:hypothetical protein
MKGTEALRLALAAALVAAGGEAYAQSLLHSFYPEVASPHLGRAVSGAGDLDGDGVPDVILGEPLAYGPGGQSGRVRVFSGPTNTVLHTWSGTAAGDEFGSSVASAGDVDSDGTPDVVVGARFTDPNGQNSGEARVYSGATGSLLWSWSGGSMDDYFGAAVAGVGDLDGDASDDVAVGVPGADTSGWDAGQVVVFSGATGSAIRTWNGAAPGDGFCSAVASAGDVDADATPDVIVGVPFGDVLAVNAGEARVFSGATGAALRVFFGSQLGGWLGHAVAGAGDVNGDGFSDLIVGAPNLYPKRAFVFSGGDRSILHLLIPPPNGVGYKFGWSVGSAGDANGDGIPDVVVGSPGSGLFQSAILYSGATGSVLQSIWGWCGSFGESVAGAGDLNGDGKDDVLVGAPGLPGAGVQPGCVTARSGSNGSVLHTWNGSYPTHQFGKSVAGAGDLDGDGAADLVVGDVPNAVRVFSGGTGTSLYSWSAYSTGSVVARVGDVNGDGVSDLGMLVVVGAGGTSAFVHIRSGATGSLLFSLAGSVYGGTSFGGSIAGVGDLDGDGKAEFAVGAPFGPVSSTFGVGSAFVFTGANGSPLYLWNGSGTERFGWAIGGVEDANGDGVPEVAVGAPYHDAGNLDQAGRVTLFSGADGSAIRTWVGFSASGHFGHAVDGAGDFDADGSGDVVVGSPDNYLAGPGTGMARVLSGATGGVLHTSFGSEPYARLGFSIAGAGDLNGDGYSDVLVEAPYQDAGGIDAGLVISIAGGTGATIDSIPGPLAYSRFGWSVASARRVDAGACEDIFVGAPYDATTGQGGAYVLASSEGGTYGYTDLGGSLAGSGGVAPLLRAFVVLQPSLPVTFSAHRVSVGASGFLVLGLSPAIVPVAGGTLVPSFDVLVPLVAGGSSSASVGFPLPSTPPAPGSFVYAQALFADAGAPLGYSATNAVSVRFP